MSFEVALRALVREEVVAALAQAAPVKAGKAAKAAPAPESAPAPATPPTAAATAPAAAPAETPAQAPTYPAFETLKKATLALAGLNRDAAVKILAGFKVVNASELKPEQYQAVIDAMEERKAQLDAAAAQASLV